MPQKDRRDLEKLLDKKLADVATKEDLPKLDTRMASKEDLAKLEARTATKEAPAKLEARMASKEDLAKLETGIRQVLEEGIIPQLDSLHTPMGDLSDAMERIERRLEAVVDRQDRQGEVLKRHDKRLTDHEQRLGILETPGT